MTLRWGLKSAHAWSSNPLEPLPDVTAKAVLTDGPARPGIELTVKF